MVTCGHKFHIGDECDWLISSSAVRPIDGNPSATKILQNLIQAHCKARTKEPRDVFGELRENNGDVGKFDLASYLQSESSGGSRLAEEEPDVRKAPAFVLEAREIQLATPYRKKPDVNGSAKEVHEENIYDSDDLDENQHVDDCPIKWYCRRRTKNGWGPCVALRRHAEDNRSQSGKKFRDRIPLEVKIGKISLNKRDHEQRGFRKQQEPSETETYKKFEVDPRVAEIHKKRLEAKLNWRPFQESDDREESELSQESSSRDGYLRPRSILGGKAPVSILLFPYHQQSNCACGRTVDKAPQIRLERVTSASQSVKPTIPIEVPHPVKILRPKTTQSFRWGSKSQKKGKRLQLPKQTNVSFETPKKGQTNHGENLPELRSRGEKCVKTYKRSSEDSRNMQSLTSLYYQLEDKSNSGRLIDDEYLEKMIKELSMEDNLRGIRNILNPGFPVKKKRFKEECHHRLARWSDDDHFKIICKQVKFSQRRPKSRIFSCNRTEISNDALF